MQAETDDVPHVTPVHRHLSRGGIDVIIVVLLGLASVVTAYATFQAAVWDGAMTTEYNHAQDSRTAAGTLYLETTQVVALDAQTWAQLVVLDVEARSPDPAKREEALSKQGWLIQTLADDVFVEALLWASEEDDASLRNPLEHEPYAEARYAGYLALIDEAMQHEDLAVIANRNSDRLTLNAVILSIPLFLLGIAAVLKDRRAKWTLIGVSTGVILVAIVLTAFVPFTGFI